MSQILYISYGQGPHEQEILFSLLTAWHWCPPDSSDIEYLIYTDRPDSYASLPVRTEYVPAETWADWAGPTGFGHRGKILALQRAMQREPTASVLLDGDTWFRRPPTELFSRIGPGRSLMHIREGTLESIHTPTISEIRRAATEAPLSRRDQGLITIPASAPIWNAGVVGLAREEAGLLDEVLDLTDQLCTRSNSHLCEQLAFSYTLSQLTELSGAADLVFHYWPPYLHAPFSRRLPEVLRESEAEPLQRRAAISFQARPRPNAARRARVVAKRIAQAFGLIRGRARSNEW